ncbi:hypothetical protein IU450_36030 [Nocardia abscessus]|uniref:hypothetical protein n=1 Tax=Nocardia abscessus TaxID=120957 RepID=UPI001895D424|nr:hypothetical protein [Nocardia abscessus]MBF6341251.1 hypothetical protein [Nocardia abscessus]
MSEPVDEISRSFGGIINGVHFAQRVADLVRGLNADARSALESQLRIMRDSQLHAARMGSIAAEDGRSQERHEIGMRQRQREIDIADEDVVRRNLDSAQRNEREERETAARVGSTHVQNQLRVAEFGLKYSDSAAENARRERATKAQIDASKAREDAAHAETQIKREDQSRRKQRENNAEERERQLHGKKIEAYDQRETRADELHELQKASIQQQMDLRARAAELTQDLAGHQQRSDKVMADAGRFAAAVSNADHAAADAFGERFRGDTGLDPSEFDTALPDLSDFGADSVEALMNMLEDAQAPDANPVTVAAARYLTNLLAADANPESGTGAPIGDAVAAANAVADPAAQADVDAGHAHQTSPPERAAASEVGP